MSTRIAAAVAVVSFLAGVVVQFWSFRAGLILMLLGLISASASVLIMQRAIQRRLMKHDRFLTQLQRSVTNGTAETTKYGSSILRRVKSLTGNDSPSDPTQLRPGDEAAPSPAQLPPRPPTASPKLNHEQAGESARPTRSELEKTSGPRSSLSGASSTPTVAEELKRDFNDEPTSRNLEKLIVYMWNTLGEITRPASLIHRHPVLARNFTASGALLARQIADAADLYTEPPKVPPRSPGSLLTPEPDRVLYCVHATPTFHSNGYAVRTRGVAEGLVANGQQVRVIGRPGYPWDVKGVDQRPRTRQLDTSGGVEYVHIPSVGLDVLPKGGYIQAAADALVREAIAFRPSVIQAASNSQTALIALIAARRLGLPFVYEVRGLWEITFAATHERWDKTERYQLDGALEALVAREADAIATITRQLGDELIRRGVSENRISIVPNSVDVDMIQPLLKDTVYEAVAGLSGVSLVGFAGSLVSYEGLDLLIDAIGELNRSGTSCHLVLAGSGSHELSLKEHVRTSGLNDVVHFLGRIPHDEVRRLLASLDVVVCPRSSNRVTEMVSPIKPLEAYAAGRVVLMSDVAPQVDLASGGSIAPLFTADDADSLAKALRQLLVDTDLRRDYERRARLWVGDHRTWRGACETLLSAYATANLTHQHVLSDVVSQREISDFAVALAGSTGPNLDLRGACRVVDLDPATSTWHETLVAHGTDLVILGTEDAEQWSSESCAHLFQIAAKLGIPTLMISDGPVGSDRSRADLARLADHLGIIGTNGVDATTSSFAGSTTTVSSILEAFDPRSVSPVQTSPAPASIAVLEDSVPPSQVLDVARAHSLRIPAEKDGNVVLPARFDECRDEFDQFDEAVRSASRSFAVLRGDETGQHTARAKLLAFGGVEVVANADTDLDWLDAQLTKLTDDLQERSRRAWKSVREANRSGGLRLSATELFRAAGLEVAYRAHPTYSVSVLPDQHLVIPQLLSQTVLPSAIVLPGGHEIDPAVADAARLRGVALTATIPTEVEFHGNAAVDIVPTTYEDLLIATRFAYCDEVRMAPIELSTHSLVSVMRIEDQAGHVVLKKSTAECSDGAGIALVVHQPATDTSGLSTSTTSDSVQLPPVSMRETDSSCLRVLIAGHDLKFVGGIIAALEAAGAIVDRDQWQFHNTHCEERSRTQLALADVILCEWGLGNAVWYSQHKRPGQRLVVRVHSQEIRTAHLRRINHTAVDAYVFVSEIVRSNAVTFHGVPGNKTHLIPNAVDIDTLRKPKRPGAKKTIGFVGSVPKLKRLDLALDVFEQVQAKDPDYCLVIKGKGPHDYAWMANRPDELAWYQKAYDRIDSLNRAVPGSVLVEGHGDDMADWYSRIGVVLSTSDFESFHYTIADGVASGARPAVLYWPGAELIYPRRWLSDTVDQVARSIVEGESEPADTEYVAEHFAIDKVTNDLKALLTDDSASLDRSVKLEGNERS